MATTYISITELCEGYKIERTYVQDLQDFGLLDFKIERNEPHLNMVELPKFEKILNFHQELKINLEGIEVILKLLEKVQKLNQDVNSLRRRLYLFEDSEPIE